MVVLKDVELSVVLAEHMDWDLVRSRWELYPDVLALKDVELSVVVG